MEGDRYWINVLRVDLGCCLTLKGRYAEAEAELIRAYQFMETEVGRDNAEIWRMVVPLVELYEAWEKPAEAAAWQNRWPEGVAR